MGERAKKGVVILALICGVLLLVTLRVFIGSVKEFKEAEKAFMKKDHKEAIWHYERAIHWYLPLSPIVRKSAERLWEIGTMAEGAGDEPLALEVYRSLRSSFYTVRSLYQPGKGWIARSDEKIASLMAKEKPYSEEDKKKTVEEKRAEALEILRRPSRPDPFWSLVVELGFFGWVGCTIGFIMRSFEMPDRFHPRRALFWGGWIVLFYGMWIVGMLRA